MSHSSSREAQTECQRRKRARWKQDGKCLAHGNVKPCWKCSESLRRLKMRDGRVSDDWCDECLTGGGLHRRDCINVAR